MPLYQGNHFGFCSVVHICMFIPNMRPGPSRIPYHGSGTNLDTGHNAFQPGNKNCFFISMGGCNTILNATRPSISSVTILTDNSLYRLLRQRILKCVFDCNKQPVTYGFMEHVLRNPGRLLAGIPANVIRVRIRQKRYQVHLSVV